MKTFSLSFNGMLIADEIYVADHFWSRFIGLQGKKSIGCNGGLLIRPCRQVHTFHMKFKIDILFLTREGTVLHLIKSSKRNTISPKIRDCYQVLELKDGTIKKNAIELGGKIKIIQNAQIRDGREHNE